MSDESSFVVSESVQDFANPEEIYVGIGTDDSAPFRCEVCGVALEYSGRGRHPRRCKEHKKGAGAAGSGKRSTNLRSLEEAVADLYRGLGMAVTMVSPTDGMQISANAGKLANSWIVLAETDPKVRKFLQKLTTGSGWGAVIIAHAMVAYPILEHHDMLPSFIPKAEQHT